MEGSQEEGIYGVANKIGKCGLDMLSLRWWYAELYVECWI